MFNFCTEKVKNSKKKAVYKTCHRLRKSRKMIEFLIYTNILISGKGEQQMFCSVCGAELKEDCNFCTKCGSPVNTANTKIQPKTTKKVQTRNVRRKKEEMFQASSRASFVYCIAAIAFALLAVLCFYQRAELYGGSLNPDRNADERWDLFMNGTMLVVFAVVCFLSWWGSTKIKLIVGDQSISGVRMIYGGMTKEFEYGYDEISEVKSLFIGILRIKINGKWVAFSNFENVERAKKLIELKIDQE